VSSHAYSTMTRATTLVSASFVITLPLVVAVWAGGCSSDREVAGPDPDPPGPSSALRGSPIRLRVDLREGKVTVEPPPLGERQTTGDGPQPLFALLGENEVQALTGPMERSAVGAFTPNRVRVTFDLTLRNNLKQVDLIPSSFPAPPTRDEVVAFPFATEPAGLFGLKVRASTDWDGAPHNFFNDAFCIPLTPPSDCFRWEGFGAMLEAGGTTAARTVGFDVDPSVHTFTVYVVLAADVVDHRFTGNITGTISSASLGPLAGILVTASPGGETATSDAAGAYSLEGLSPGSVTLNVSGTPTSCFPPANVSVVVNAGATITANFPVRCHRIAFQLFNTPDDEVYTVNADGSGQTPLTNNTFQDSDPSWSPDGTRLAFSSEGTFSVDGEVYVMNADGSNKTPLTDDDFYDFDTSWSPEGSKIAFVSSRGGQLDLFVINPDGTGQTQLTNTPAGEADPTWSPDGTKLAFNLGGDIYVMNASPGSTPTLLTGDNPFTDADPAWSPDGSKIAYTAASEADDGEGSADHTWEISFRNADGTGSRTRVTTDDFFDLEPAWSPDGSKLVYTSSRGPYGLYIVNVDGSGEIQLTLPGQSAMAAAWW
jgi:hypothetical protein